MHKITVLHVPGCSGARAALEIAHHLASSRDDIQVEEVVIESEAMAAERGFRGSPTVLVDEQDIESQPQTPVGAMG